jgi:hypothetical protein
MTAGMLDTITKVESALIMPAVVVYFLYQWRKITKSDRKENDNGQ